ncbi:MAG: phosphoribosylformylglycinamidine cyclo-ligase [Desulfobacterales bacterium]|nr:phosphoribosylformylglycinamidine cyclo-ligase [Deltaproteobacteria bacterium]NNK93515.1 phosphoribosylformylglycinamidine cyclo-ligase [Desulfobacterales bacterium]
MSEKPQSQYQQAGVDIDKGNAFVKAIKNIVTSTHQPAVINEIGGFSSLYSLEKNAYDAPVLVSSTDGVGTKLAIAQLCGKHDTIGIDLVAMCVNDVIVSGAKPLFFLDYFSVGKLDLEIATDVVRGISEGCRQAQCSLVGGETAEMPGLYRPGDYDLAGFVTGIVDRKNIIDGSRIKAGDKIIGLASNGLHSNGFSLVRKVCFSDLGLTVDSYIDSLSSSLGKELLKPTRIYVRTILAALQYGMIHGMIHNTGGGFYDNIPRVLPQGCMAIIDKSAWDCPPIFSFLAANGQISEQEMFRTFNMGIGFMIVVDEKEVAEVLRQCKAFEEHATVIGEIVSRKPHEAEVVITSKND